MTPGTKGIAISVGGDLGGLAGFLAGASIVGSSGQPADLKDLISGGGTILATTLAGSLAGTLLTAKLIGAPYGAAIGVQLVSNIAGGIGSAVFGWPGMVASDTTAAYFAGRAWL